VVDDAKFVPPAGSTGDLQLPFITINISLPPFQTRATHAFVFAFWHTAIRVIPDSPFVAVYADTDAMFVEVPLNINACLPLKPVLDRVGLAEPDA
jgi:hypothetical protein